MHTHTPSTNFINQLVEQTGDPSIAAQLPPDDPRRQQSERLGIAFSSMMSFLGTHFPEQRINSLASTAGEILRMGKVFVAMTNEMEDIFFTALLPKPGTMENGYPVAARAAILLPVRWDQKVRSDYFLQLGGVLFQASMAVDFYNERHYADVPGPNIGLRAAAWEATYLEKLRETNPGIPLSEHQTMTLARFPGGFNNPKTAKDLLYTYRNITRPS